MAGKRRAAPGDGMLLGMIVDRSSFDEEDRNSQDDDDLTVDTQSGPRRKDGKVRRKLRWKPPAFRNRKRQSSAASVASFSDRSTRTRDSFHTFHSTETPVQSNKTNEVRRPISRPNYRDTFEGVSTIDNEGEYVHAGRFPDKPSLRSRSLPSVSSAVTSTSSEPESWNFQTHGKEFSPYGIEDDLSTSHPVDRAAASFSESSPIKTSPVVSAPSSRSYSGPKQVRPSPTMSPLRANRSYGSPRKSPPQSVNTITSTDSMTDEDIDSGVFFAEDFEQDRRIDFFASRLTSLNEPDAAAGLLSDSSVHHKPAPEQRSVRRIPSRLPLGRPPVFPNRKLPVIPVDEPSSPPVSSPSVQVALPQTVNVGKLIANTALLSGPGYLPEMTMTKAANKAYHRPVEATSPNRRSRSPVRRFRRFRPSSPKNGDISTQSDDNLFSDDPPSSVEVDGERDDLVIITSTDAVEPIVGGVVSHGTRAAMDPKTASTMTRARTGPVDVDDGAFVEAERNLKAIHEMAAEHLSHGEYEEALEVFEEVLRGQKERYGEDHYRIGTALHNIGIVHLRSGNNEKAVEVCRQAVLVRKRSLVPNHPDVAVSLAQLGVAYLECKDYRKALAAFRDALRIRREFLGPKHPKVGKILNNIGCALYEMDELRGATLAFEEALEIHREALRDVPILGEGADPRAPTDGILLSIAATLANIASTKLRRGENEDATIALEEALLIQQSVLGDEHPTVINTLGSINQIDSGPEKGYNVASFLSSFVGRGQAVDNSKTIDDASCSSPRTVNGMAASMSLVQNFTWGKSQKFYERVGEILQSSNAACGAPDDDDPGSDTTTYSYSVARSQGHEI